MKTDFESVDYARERINQIPILFQTDMIQAYQQGTKSQTRRTRSLKHINLDPDAYKFIGFRWNYDGKKNKQRYCACFEHIDTGFINNIESPYGKQNDLLWVRETGWVDNNYQRGLNRPSALYWKADYDTYDDLTKVMIRDHMCQFSAIHMYKDFCRHWLRNTEVRVQRLREISTEDALAEGITRWKNMEHFLDQFDRKKLTTTEKVVYDAWKDAEKFNFPVYRKYIDSIEVPEKFRITDNAVESYISLFLSINEQLHFDLNHPKNNPWVWVIGFEMTDKPKIF